MTPIEVIGWCLLVFDACVATFCWLMFILLALPGRDRTWSWSMLFFAIAGSAIVALQWETLHR